MFGSAKVVIPHDTTINRFSALYVGGAGNISIVTEAGQTMLFSGIPAGTTLLIKGTKVRSTNTTATLIVALS